MARNRDLEGVIRTLARMPKAVKKVVQPAVDKGADELIGLMEMLAPVAEGELKVGIRKEETGVPMSARVVAVDKTTTGGGDNALYQEYGTSQTPAQPFFWPAVRVKRKRIRRRIDRAIVKAVKAEWGKQ